MSFNNPSFLWAFGVLAIPIILHFLQLRRYKKLHFSDLSLLRFIQKDQRKSKKIKDWTLLAIRLLAISSLVIAFAKPHFQSDTKYTKQDTPLVIYIDNSPSMNLSATEGPLWNVAVQRARTLVNHASKSQEYLCFTNDLDGSELRKLSSIEMQDVLNNIKPGNAQINWSQLKNRIDARYQCDSLNMLIFSDFQKAFISEKINHPNLTFIRLKPEKMEGNLAIDSAWIEAPVFIPGANIEVKYSVSGYNNQSNIPFKVSLKVNGIERGIQNLSMETNSRINGKFNLIVNQEEIQKIELNVEDEPLHFDNTYRLVAHVQKHFNVLVIAESNVEVLEKIFNDSSTTYNYCNAQNIPYDRLHTYNAIFAEDQPHTASGEIIALNKYVEEGGNLIYIPNSKGHRSLAVGLGLSDSPLTDATEIQPATINSEDPFFEGMFELIPDLPKLPTISHYTDIAAANSTSLIALSNYTNWLSRKEIEKGQVFFIGSPLQDDSWTLSELCAPLVWQMAIFKSNIQTSNFRLNTPQIVQLQNVQSADPPVILKMGKEEIIPKQWMSNKGLTIDPKVAWSESGFAEVTINGDTIDTWAFQSPSKEGELAYYDDEEIEHLTEHQARIITNIEDAEIIAYASDSNDHLDWMYFVYAALAFFLVETIVLRTTKR